MDYSTIINYVFDYMSDELYDKLEYEDLELFYKLEQDFMKQTKLIIEGVVMLGDESEEELMYYIQKNISEELVLTSDEVKQLLWLEQQYYEELEKYNNALKICDLGKIEDESNRLFH